MLRLLNETARDEAERLPASKQMLLKQKLKKIDEILHSKEEKIILREHQPGDMGWVIERHGALYAEEYQWNSEFEALVAGIGSDFLKHFNPEKERAWIAELNGERVGCIFLVDGGPGVAKLRLLLIDPKARGRGLAHKLVSECTQFARAKDYKKIVLWTDNSLAAARHTYKKHGFKLTEKEAHKSFGHELVGETWELEL